MDNWLNSDWVHPLGHVENTFLQCLVTDFALERPDALGRGVRLTLSIDDKTPTIWLRRGKDFVRSAVAADRAQPLARDLDAFILRGVGDHKAFHESANRYCFRYASGGTLPIVRWEGDEYYCLFYRDLFPIGWNIANGGAATRDELLTPLLTAERELREELVVVDPAMRRRYVFPSQRGRLLERPEFAAARLHLEQVLNRNRPAGFDEMAEQDIPMTWMEGPDSLAVHFGDQPATTTTDCFVTITAEDFGIEIDRVAKILVPEGATLFDGEILNGAALNRPIGLFRIRAMHEKILNEETEFIPDVYFHNAAEGKSTFRTFMDVTFDRQVARMRDNNRLAEFRKCTEKYQLCPVTKRLIARQAGLLPPDLFADRTMPRGPKPKYDVFVSCGRGDESLAAMVHQYVTDELHRSAYFYTRSARDTLFLGEIEDALATAQFLIAVATQPGLLTRNYPNYERLVFLTRVLNGQSPRNAGIIPYIGFVPEELPVGYSLFAGIQFDPTNPGEKLAELRRFLS